MKLKLRALLSAMMFLQYAVWGAWAPILAGTMTERLNASGMQVAGVFEVLWLACIITPFIGGQLVDRYMSSQHFLAIAAAGCTLAAFMMSTQQDVGALTGWMWLWSLLYAPTLGITNSIVLYHMTREGLGDREQEKEFAIIRTAGTVGWSVAGWALSGYLLTQGKATGWRPYEEMQLAAAFGVLLTLLALFLPNTPPNRNAASPWAFAKAFALFGRVPGFLTFMVISFVVSTEFQFFYTFSAPFLQSVGVDHSWVPVTKTISQVCEVVALALFLPLSLRHLGMRKTLVIGVLAWPLRYFIFAMLEPQWLIIASLGLHGIGFAFVFVTSQLFVDRVAPRDIKASAQSLLTLVTLGFGNWAGTRFSGWLKDQFTRFELNAQTGAMEPGAVNWPMIFIIPAVICIVCALAFWLTFREPKDSGGGDDESPGEAILESTEGGNVDGLAASRV